MSRTADSISRRAALQRALAVSIGVASTAAALPRQAAGALGAQPSVPLVQRLRVAYLRDRNLTGSDELRFFHGSTTRLQPSLGARFVAARGSLAAHELGLQCVEFGPSRSVQRLCFAGALPEFARGQAVPAADFQASAQTRAIQAIHAEGSAASVFGEVFQTSAPQPQELWVIAGTSEQLSLQLGRFTSVGRRNAEATTLLQLEDSALQIALLGADLDEAQLVASRDLAQSVLQVSARELHARIFAALKI